MIDDNVELFWVTFDQSVRTLSINTLWVPGEVQGQSYVSNSSQASPCMYVFVFKAVGGGGGGGASSYATVGCQPPPMQ